MDHWIIPRARRTTTNKKQLAGCKPQNVNLDQGKHNMHLGEAPCHDYLR